MLAGTASQVAFALAYRAIARHGRLVPFAATTVSLAHLHWPALPTFALVIATLATGYILTRRPSRATRTADAVATPPGWDIPLRLAVATAVVLTITALAPITGPYLAGLLSPFPVFGAALALFTHHTHGPTAVIAGLLAGLATPAVFFLVLALTLPPLGLASFALATLAALITQAGTMFTIPPSSR
jgi:hypothetical protein